MIKGFIVNGSINMIKELNKYNDTQLEEIKYGLEGIYLAITKILGILLLSLLAGLFKETLLLLFFFNALSVTAFGIHASKSSWCWISSIICFLGIAYISKSFVFNEIIFYIIIPICFIFIVLYAPADTAKRPLINTKKRKKYKIITLITTTLYILLLLLINNIVIKNLILFSIILETILILPITYKLFKAPYKNYLSYK